VAEVLLKTKKKSCFDEFKNNQNTGRFVIVDGYDVSGGGIVSGLTQELQTVSKFAKKNMQMVVNCFDEYYYVFAEDTVKKLPGRPHTFSVGDVIPSAGQTYEYPGDFDVLDIQTKLVASIRKSKLYDVVKLNQYSYAAVPMIDAKGSFIRVESKKELIKFTDELEGLPNAEGTKATAFANKWLVFTRFRGIRYLKDVASPEFEYQI
jgi:sulfate adenylyltransferase subunit 1